MFRWSPCTSFNDVCSVVDRFLEGDRDQHGEEKALNVNPLKAKALNVNSLKVKALNVNPLKFYLR